MEREELELINRLKNTKMVEEQAHQHLHSAMHDPLSQSQTSFKPSQSTQSRKGTATGRRR
jgi:hypothetical protein